MDESDIRLKVQHALSACGGYYHHPVDTPVKQYTSRPDIVHLLPTRPAPVIEVKKTIIYESVEDGHGTFGFAQISDKQRMLLDSLNKINHPVFVAIGGILRRVQKNDSLVGIYVIPWKMWYEFENKTDKVSCTWKDIANTFPNEAMKYILKGEYSFEPGSSIGACLPITDNNPFEWTVTSRRFEK